MFLPTLGPVIALLPSCPSIARMPHMNTAPLCLDGSGNELLQQHVPRRSLGGAKPIHLKENISLDLTCLQFRDYVGVFFFF